MTTRRKFISRSLKAGGALALGSQALPLLSATPAIEKKLTILHTNDMHSRIDPFPARDPKYAGLGGMARRSTLIGKIRRETENLALFDSGDILQGTPYFNYFGGKVEFQLMSTMGYDLATLGNHDFDGGMEQLHQMLPNASFDFVSANYDFTDTILRGSVLPYKVLDKGGIKIGVFGLGIDPHGLVPDKHYKGMKYLDPVEMAKGAVGVLKKKSCDLIVCLSHLGYEYKNDKISDLKLAEQISGIDIILGGHTHTLLDKPTEITHKDGHTTLINQVGWAGIAVGRIDVVLHNGEKKISSTGNISVNIS